MLTLAARISIADAMDSTSFGPTLAKVDRWVPEPELETLMIGAVWNFLNAVGVTM